MTIDGLGRPQRSEIVSRKAGNPGRKMHEVFTTNGYAILDDKVKLSTPDGVFSLERLARNLLAGERVLVESLPRELGVRKHREEEVMHSPGAIQIANAMVARMIENVEATFASKREATIPRLCFSSTSAILGRLRKRSRTSLHCDVDNRIYPCEIFISADGKMETQLLAITDFVEDEVTTLEIPSTCKAIVIDGLICS
jgi:sulfatase maturation enzyme AslB (radical SAM superfamily)